jgi:hypothetical protein
MKQRESGKEFLALSLLHRNLGKLGFPLQEEEWKKSCDFPRSVE